MLMRNILENNMLRFSLLRPLFKIKTLLLLVLSGYFISACSQNWAADIDIPPRETVDCKIRAYLDSGVRDFVSTRYRSHLPVRMAILPFIVPETFAPVGDVSRNFGRELASKFQMALLGTQEISIVELFDRERWPGRKEEFFAGNYKAIQFARDGGYDLLMIGYMEPPINDKDMVVHTKVIDAVNGVTLWHATTTATSYARQDRKLMSRFEMVKNRPDLFAFTERTAELVQCTVNDMFKSEVEE